MPEPFMEVMPETSVLDDQDRLLIGGCELGQLAEEFGTPITVVDEQALRRTAREYLTSFRAVHPDSDIYFAVKAFPASAIIGILAEEGIGADVDSAGEMIIALAGGMPAGRILLHGNAKTDEDIRFALDAGIGMIAIDSLDDIDRLGRLADWCQDVLLRINPDVLAPTHEKMATGHAASKFGVPETQIETAIARIEAEPHLNLKGVHGHIGSQILSLEPFSLEVAKLAKIGSFSTFNLGGGLGVRYTPDSPPAPGIREYAESLAAAVHTEIGRECRLMVEPGRSMVATSAVTLYSVVGVKRGGKTFVSVNGGMSDNLEPMLYGTRFAPGILNPGERETEICDVVGKHCETGDTLVPGVALPRPRVDDLLIIPVTGAYTHSMASNYNGALRMPVVLCADGQAHQVIRRETLEELLQRNV